MIPPVSNAASWQPKEECRTCKSLYLEGNQAEQDQQMRQQSAPLLLIDKYDCRGRFLLLIKVTKTPLRTLADGKLSSRYTIGGNTWTEAKRSRRELRYRRSALMHNTIA
jgi:hypothetical protein